MHLFYSSPVYRAFVNFYHYRQPPGDDGQTIEQLLTLRSENFEANTRVLRRALSRGSRGWVILSLLLVMKYWRDGIMLKHLKRSR